MKVDTREVTFLPHRLNRQPVIVRGLTADELWITVGVSAAIGIAIGIVVAFALKSIPIVPTIAVASIAIGIFAGGGVLRRHKRGRPETWLYRHMQWRVVSGIPLLKPYLGARELITRSGAWSTRRSTTP